MDTHFYMILVYCLIINDNLADSTSCGFENTASPFCGWKNDGWLPDLYSHDSVLTGPRSAKEGVFYIKTNITAPSFKATIGIPVDTNTCLLFWYYMYGAHISNLTVLNSQSGNLLWIRRGDHGERWICGAVSIPQSVDEIVIEANKGSGIYDVIALDSIQVVSISSCLNSSCNRSFDGTIQSSSPPTGSTTLSTTVYSAQKSTEKSWLSGTSIDFNLSQTETNSTSGSESRAGVESTASITVSNNISIVIGIPCAVLVACIIAVIIFVSCSRIKKKPVSLPDHLTINHARGTSLSGRYRDGLEGTPEVYDTINQDEEYDQIPVDYVSSPIDGGYIEAIDVSDVKDGGFSDVSFKAGTIPSVYTIPPIPTAQYRMEEDNGYITPKSL